MLPSLGGPGSGQSQWAQKYQLNPIFLMGGTGLAPGSSPNNDIPVTTYTDANPQQPTFAKYMPLPGASLLKYQASTFPFANQAIAANAVIQQPLNIAMMMICPVQSGSTWEQKLGTMNALVHSLQQHINLGGLFNVNTPSQTYTACILLDIRDVSQGETKQPQYKYQWDFYVPLITLDQAQAVLNTLLAKLSSGAAPNPTVPTVTNALAASRATAPQLSQALQNNLGPALLTAGLSTAQLPGVVSSSVQLALSGNFSPLELAAHMAAIYTPATRTLGMSPGAALDLFSTNTGLALNQVGVSPILLTNMFKASLGPVQIPGVNVNNPANPVQ